MNWDEFEGGEDETAAAELRVCQDGQHQATIVWAGIQQKEWAKNETANPSGKVLTVKIDIGKGIAPVWDSIPAHRRGVVAAVCIAARVVGSVPGGAARHDRDRAGRGQERPRVRADREVASGAGPVAGGYCQDSAGQAYGPATCHGFRRHPLLGASMSDEEQQMYRVYLGSRIDRDGVLVWTQRGKACDVYGGKYVLVGGALMEGDGTWFATEEAAKEDGALRLREMSKRLKQLADALTPPPVPRYVARSQWD